MISSFAHAVAQRPARERLLLAVFLGVVVPVAFVFLLALPLLEQRDAARSALADAQANRAWYVLRQAEIAALPQNGEAPVVATRAAVGLGGIEESLIAANLRASVSLLANVQGDDVSLTINAVRFEALMGWIDTVEADAGYHLSALRLEQGGGDGLVTAELRLEPQQ